MPKLPLDRPMSSQKKCRAPAPRRRGGHAGEVPAQVLQRLMRHADIKATMDYYANVVDDAAGDAVRGPQGNRSRNTQPTPAEPAQKA
jgi:hypothetical protein